ncbi:MAG: hypothetical protein IKF71_00715 [Bacilli bacterium]|nr:hypothetical protein [Bacilli bacterium]
MIVEEDRIYINQFQRMIILEENHICFSTLHKKIHIYGKELKTKKLVEQEILLTGIINRIEVEDAR